MLWYGQVDLVPSPKSSVMLGYSLPVPRLHSWLLWLLLFLLVLFYDANYLVTFISLIFMQIYFLNICHTILLLNLLNLRQK